VERRRNVYVREAEERHGWEHAQPFSPDLRSGFGDKYPFQWIGEREARRASPRRRHNTDPAVTPQGIRGESRDKRDKNVVGSISSGVVCKRSAFNVREEAEVLRASQVVW